MNKKEAKKSIATTILKVAKGCYKSKTTGELFTLENLSEEIINKFQTTMNEHKISRKSIHDTICCSFYTLTDEERENIHKFCFTKLK